MADTRPSGERAVPSAGHRTPHVVVGVVDSSAGRRALRVAYNAARQLDGDLFILTCYRTSATSDRARRGERQSLESAMKEQGRVVSDELGITRWSMSTYCDAVPGEPVDVLLRSAINADFLVVGDGDGDDDQTRSIAAECLRWAPCRVIVA